MEITVISFESGSSRMRLSSQIFILVRVSIQNVSKLNACIMKYACVSVRRGVVYVYLKCYFAAGRFKALTYFDLHPRIYE